MKHASEIHAFEIQTHTHTLYTCICAYTHIHMYVCTLSFENFSNRHTFHNIIASGKYYYNIEQGLLDFISFTYQWSIIFLLLVYMESSSALQQSFMGSLGGFVGIPREVFQPSLWCSTQRSLYSDAQVRSSLFSNDYASSKCWLTLGSIHLGLIFGTSASYSIHDIKIYIFPNQ